VLSGFILSVVTIPEQSAQGRVSVKTPANFAADVSKDSPGLPMEELFLQDAAKNKIKKQISSLCIK